MRVPRPAPLRVGAVLGVFGPRTSRLPASPLLGDILRSRGSVMRASRQGPAGRWNHPRWPRADSEAGRGGAGAARTSRPFGREPRGKEVDTGERAGGRWTGAVGVGVGVGVGGVARASQVRCASLPVGGGEEIAGRAGVPSSSPEPTARPALHHMGSARRPARDHRGPVIQGPRGGRSAWDSPAVRVSAPAVAAQLPGSCLFSEPNLFCPTLHYATPCHAVLVRIVLS